MSKVKPLIMSFPDAQALEAMRQEYEFIGRETEVNQRELKLTVLTLPKKYKKKSVREAKARAKSRDGEFDLDEYEY
jgi:hypothetical protein